MVWTPAPFPTLIAWLTFSVLPVCSLLTAQWSNAEPGWTSCRAAILAIGAALVAMQVWQWFQSEDPQATFLNRNSLAAFLSLAVFLGASRIVSMPRARSVERWSLLGISGILGFGIGITGGRGGLLAFAGGSFIGLIALWRNSERRNLMLGWLAATGCGVLIANAMTAGGVLTRLGTMENPVVAGAQRFDIWDGAIRMFVEAPNLGVGAGTFWLAYPPFRSVSDGSGGFYAHNDYIQAAVELGWPGLLLLVLALAGVALVLWRLACKRHVDQASRAEGILLGCGLAACAAHSLVTFNFYLLPILMTFGMILGHLLAVARDLGTVRGGSWSPSNSFSPAVWRIVVVLAALVPLTYLGALGWAHVLYDQARVEAQRGDLIAADRTLQHVTRLLPRSDASELARAGLFHSILRRNPEMSEADRKAVFQAALNSLSHAQRVNPLRPDPLAIRGELLWENPDLAADIQAHAIADQFHKALSLDPLYVRARMDLATYLQQAKNDPQGARRVLEAGVDYMYPPREYVLRYLQRVADLREASGDPQGARELKDRIKRYSESLSKEKNKSGRQNWWERPVTRDATHSS